MGSADGEEPGQVLRAGKTREQQIMTAGRRRAAGIYGAIITAAIIAAVGGKLPTLALAVSVFERLARDDPRFAARAADARLAFRVANWPPAEREAARTSRLTRAQAAELVWWMVPEVREAKGGGGVIASDALSRRDSRSLTAPRRRACSKWTRTLTA
jgi:hypothetical protein